MCTRREIHFAILFVVVGSVSASLCPENKICSCKWSVRDSMEIICKINDSSINIEFDSIEIMKVTCSNTNWSDFQLHNLTKRSVNSVHFFKCNLPKNRSLKTITDMLGATNVEKLFFHSYKNLISFKRFHLNGFENLRVLDLSNNIIINIDTDLLADLPNLIRLNLRNSNLIISTLFDHVPKLQKLDLAENNLELIKPGIFDKFHNLTWLSLAKDNLTELEPKIFDKLRNLFFIDLLSNNLVSLPENIFGNLKALESLSLAENNFTLLPKYLLQNNKNLRLIDISFNKKQLDTLPDGFFRNLTNLEMVKLEKNGLTFLPEDLLWGCFSLTSLILSRNNIGFLHKLIFQDLKNLTELKLDSNAFRKLPNIFQDLKQLKILDLSKNHISSIDEMVFKELENLEELNMAENSLTMIANKSFISLYNLQIANFSHNNLTFDIVTSNSLFDSYISLSPFASCRDLKELYLSHNRISKIFRDWVSDMVALQKLDLKNNYISHLSTEDLIFKSIDIVMDLTYNKIQFISLNKDVIDEKDLFNGEYEEHVVILIEHNPLRCDCELYDYLHYLEGKMLPTMKTFIKIDPKNLTCFTPFKLRNVRIVDLQSESFNCVEMKSDIASMCPDKCKCFKNLEDEEFVIDCSRRNFTVVPIVKNIPHKFWQIKLNLSDNQLTQMPNLTKLGYGPVSTLILSNNNISEISLDGLPKSLEALELHYNKISKISSDVLNFFNCSNLYLLTLHGNPFICDCNTTDFFYFTHTFKSHIIADLHRITCQQKNTFISKMTIIDFCPNNMNNNTTGWFGRNSTWIIFVIVGLSISIISLFYCMYRKQFKRKSFAHRSIIEYNKYNEDDEEYEEDEEEEEINVYVKKCYDIFVSYSQYDHVFVTSQLVDLLENCSKPLKLCLPYRDWPVSEWTTTNVMKSMELSRRMMIVLSPSFIQNVWKKKELRVAHYQALEKNESDLIIILYGEIEPTDFDSELTAFINAHSNIKWREPDFWKKLEQLLKCNVKDKRNRDESAFRYHNQEETSL